MVLASTRKPRFVPDPSQPGLFEFDSVVRVVHLDAAMIVGGIRALLLQSLHPKAMAAVVEFSDFKQDPFGRLRRTVDFLGWTTYGTLQKAEESIAVVRKIHDRVSGTTPSGESYSANDPHLLMWVHVAEVESFLVGHELFGRPRLSQQEKDGYVADMGIIAERLGADLPPRSFAELRATIASYGDELGLTSDGREAIAFLADFPFSPWAKVVYRVMFKAALGSLPSWAQKQLGYEVNRVANNWFYRPTTHALIRVLDWGLKSDMDLSRYPSRPTS